MTELKMNPLMRFTVVSDFSNSGSVLNAAFSKTDSSEVSTLNTAVNYIQEQSQIKALMDLYASLIAKDVQELQDMISFIQESDSIISNQIISAGDTYGL